MRKLLGLVLLLAARFAVDVMGVSERDVVMRETT